MEDLDLPEIKRKKLQEKKADDKKEFKDLFQSDSGSDDDEDDDGLRIKGKLDCRKIVSFERASQDTLSSRWLCLSQTGPVRGES